MVVRLNPNSGNEPFQPRRQQSAGIGGGGNREHSSLSDRLNALDKKPTLLNACDSLWGDPL